MPKNSQSNSKVQFKQEVCVGSRILEALTEGEISQLLDELFVVLSDEQRVTAFAQLQADTQETLTQIITPPQTVEQVKTSNIRPTSNAKLAQTWSQLWEQWNQIIWQASQEEGKYIVQEVSWEEPYFDDCTFVEDLEAVAQKMKPLVKTAFENGFSNATENRISEWKFIETEPLGVSGEAGEQLVWQKVRENFTDGEGVAFWSYRTFSHQQQIRREADILIVSKDLHNLKFQSF